MDTIGERIKHFRKLAGLTQEDAAQKAGVTNATITRYEKGIIDNIPRDRISALACAFGCDPAELMGWTRNVEPTTAVPDSLQKLLTTLPLYDLPVSAGTGTWIMDGDDYEYVEFENVPKGAEFALRVRGNSMEPMYSDGDTIFVKTQVIVDSWQAGVFCLNGEGYLKMLQGRYLVSSNKEYDPIPITDYDNFFCFGRVVGKAVQ